MGASQLALLLLRLLALGVVLSQQQPPPRRQQQQTPTQRARMAKLASAARKASGHATAQLEARLNRPSLRSALRAAGADTLAALPAAELARRWRAEVDVAEIAHGFDTAPNLNDVDLQHAAALEYFPNQWELEVLYPRNLSDPAAQHGRWGADGYLSTMAPAAAAETSPHLYGLPSFTGRPPAGVRPGIVPGKWPSSLAEAAERMVYGVLNSHRLDFPCAYWGNAAVVFNSSAVAPLLTLSPMDSGDFTAACPKVAGNFTADFCQGWAVDRCDCWLCRPEAGKCAPSQSGSSSACDVWDLTLGTSGSFDHILIPWADWHGDQADKMTALMLARMLTPWGSPPAYPNFTSGAGDYYHEANLVGRPVYEAGAVKFVLAQFAQHFGAESGAGLRRWAAQHGWPLIWAWGIGNRPILSMPPGTWAGKRPIILSRSHTQLKCCCFLSAWFTSGHALLYLPRRYSARA
jgi:hypothetical protein